MADEEVNKLAAATYKLRNTELELARAREEQEQSLRAMIDSANVDIGLKDWTQGLSVGLENWAGDMTGQLVLINEKLQNLVDNFKGPDASTLTESSLESPDQEGKVPKSEKGGVFGKAVKGIKSWIAKFAKWKTLIIGVLALIIGGLALKYWEPIKEFVVDKLVPALKDMYNFIVPIAESVANWIAESLLPEVFDFFFKSIDDMKKMFENVVARFEGWGEMDFKEKVFAILGVFEDLGTYVADVARNMLVAIGNLFGADGEALAEKYFDPIRAAISGVIDWVKLAFTDPMGALSALWSGLLGGATTIGNWIWDNAIKPPIEWVMEKFAWAGDAVVEGWTTLKDFITGIYTDTIDFWKRKFAAVGDLAVAGWTNLKDFITDTFESVVFFFQDIFRWSKNIVVEGFHDLTSFIIDTYNKVVEFFTRMFQWGGDIIKEGWNGVVGFVTGVYDQVIDFFTRMFAWGGDIVREGWNGLTGFITGAYDNVVGFFTDKFTFVSDALEGFSLTDTIRQAVQNIKDFFWNDQGTGLLDFDFSGFSMPDFSLNAVTEKIKNLVRGIVDILPDFLVPDKIAEWLELPSQARVAEPDFTLPLAGGAEITAEMANRVYRGAGPRGASMNVNAPTTAVDASSASSTVNVFQRGRPGASDGYTLAQGRNQRTRFSN